jgi:hypothetical protein
MKVNRSRLKMATFLLCLSISGLASSNWFPKDSSPIELTRAHAAYLERDFPKLTKEIVAALKSDQFDVRKNALDLWRSALETNSSGNIPVDWKLPSEILKMNLDLSYISIQDRLEYDFRVKGEMQEIGSLSQLQIIQFPSKVILDKKAGIGKWDEQVTEKGAHYELKSKRSRNPIPEGLYLINIVTSNGHSTNGWFIVSDLVSSDTPKMIFPKYGDTVRTGNPTIKWNDFTSPEYKSSERKSHSVWIAKEDTNEKQWDFYQFDGHITQTTVGRDPLGNGVESLANGTYFMVLNYNESRQFGDLRMRRSSKTMTSFHVKLD